MAKIFDRLADRTGMGEVIIGAVFLGGSTSGIVTSVTAAATDHPGLAISKAIGGIAAQTLKNNLFQSHYQLLVLGVKYFYSGFPRSCYSLLDDQSVF